MYPKCISIPVAGVKEIGGIRVIKNPEVFLIKYLDLSGFKPAATGVDSYIIAVV